MAIDTTAGLNTPFAGFQPNLPAQKKKKQPGLIEDILDPFAKTGKTLLGGGYEILRAAASPFTDYDKAAASRVFGGKKKDAVQELLQSFQTSKNPIYSQADLEKIDKDPLGAVTDQVKASAGVASYAVPFGKGASLLSKYVVPGAVVSGAQEFSRKDSTPKSIATQAALGGGISGVTGPVLQRALGMLGGASKQTQGLTERLAVKPFKASPTAQKNFQKATGVPLGKFIQDNNLVGAGYDDVLGRVEPLQQKFDDVVQSNRLNISKKSLVNNFDQEIKRLLDSTLPSEKAKAKVVQEIRDNVANSVQDEIPASYITELRREADKAVKSFAQDEVNKGPYQILRNVYQSSLQNEADKQGILLGKETLKQAGVRLKNLYKLLDIAEDSQFKGGSKTIGFPAVIAGGAGGALAGIPGAVAGVALEKGLNSPTAQSLLSKGINKTGELVSRAGPAAAGVLERNATPIGQVSSRALGLIGEQLPQSADDTDETSQQESFQTAPPTESVAEDANPYPLENYIADLQRDPDNAGIYKEVFERYQEQYKATGGKPVSAERQKQMDLADSGLRSLKIMREQIGKDPIVLYKAALPTSYGARKYKNQADTVKDIISRLRSGAALTPAELEFYEKQIPSFLDSAEEVQSKLDTLEYAFNNVKVTKTQTQQENPYGALMEYLGQGQ